MSTNSSCLHRQEYIRIVSEFSPPLLPPNAPHSDHTRVGWATPKKEIIFFGYYVFEDNIIPKRTVGITQYAKVIFNYETLNADQKTRVPETACKGAIALKKLYKPVGDQG